MEKKRVKLTRAGRLLLRGFDGAAITFILSDTNRTESELLFQTTELAFVIKWRRGLLPRLV